ncbi:hypothetical protein TWF569_000022 [Orbilia oligospora]|uniref:Uncharacterized protein n=1 Tax=Orbilia oligospora TaxID=2813651 RepID=A0A7C8N9U4_ORBOL|nr:hypothetical protein TWF103_002628 [Orbilia oligospora]KAF3102027.1 hypothetical protein TWF102_004753 [Orbilia oligospora]KAF3157440.1 hypothetical protein TWF569_000022 [Orbilia oligospora]
MSNAGTAQTPHTRIDLDLRREESVNTDTSSGVVIANGERRHGKKKKDGALRNKTSELLLRLFLALCSSAFIVLPFFAYSLDGREVQQYQDGKKVLESIKWGPTIFPIVFAATTGGFLQAVALRQAQKGARLGTLEQLTRTVNIFTAVTTPYFIKAYNWLSFILLLLWAASPLGGQASLRLLSTQLVPFQTPTNVRFLSPTNITSYIASGGRNYGTWRTQAEYLYTASLLGIASSKYRSTDLWDNVRIPFIEEIEKQTPKPGPNGWYDVTKNTTYSSLLGIPIRGLTNNITVDVRTSYSRLGCSFFELVNGDDCFNKKSGRCFNAGDPHVPEWIFPASEHNKTWREYSSYISVALNISQTLPRAITPDGIDSPDPVDLIFESPGSLGVSVGWCKLSQTYVEARVNCPSSNCAVSKLRRLNIGTPRPPLFFNATPGRIGSLANFVQDFSEVSKAGKPSFSNFNQGYIYNPDDPIASTDRWVNIVDVGKENFEIRMTQLINTLMGAVQGPALFLSDHDIQPGNNTYYSRLGRYVAAESSTGESTVLKELFVCYKGWAALMLFAAGLLTAIGVSSAIIAYTTLAPDTLASLSSMAAESRYFDVEHKDSTLDRDGKAIALKDRVVKLGDVESSGETGYIALGTVDTDKGGVRELSIDRVYR